MRPLLKTSYEDLSRSVRVTGLGVPSFDEAFDATRQALLDGYLMITKVNSDKDIEELLDDSGQLRLRTPLNMFIGGQILDRGLTIENLIGFYYGRNPKRFQQDTVLQHSRMYGPRPKEDLTVTRFYAPPHIYQIMKKINEFDTALREAFLEGAHDRGVYFIQRDVADRLIPCSPNKLMFSKLTTVRPGRRLLAAGFQTVSRSAGRKNLDLLDRKIETLLRGRRDGSATISLDVAVKVLELAYENLEFDDPDQDERNAHIALLEHLSKCCEEEGSRGQVQLIAASNREIARLREEGRFSNAPDTKQQQDNASTKIPGLIMLRENGMEDKGWRGLPFWWPVIVVPRGAVTRVFAAEAPADGATGQAAATSSAASTGAAPGASTQS